MEQKCSTGMFILSELSTGRLAGFFFARFCTSQPACQQLCDLFSKPFRLLTWQVLKLLSISVHHLMGSQLFLWLLVWITEWLVPGLPKLPSVFSSSIWLHKCQLYRLPCSCLAFEVWLLWLPYCTSIWTCLCLSIRNATNLLPRSSFLADCLAAVWTL